MKTREKRREKIQHSGIPLAAGCRFGIDGRLWRAREGIEFYPLFFASGYAKLIRSAIGLDTVSHPLPGDLGELLRDRQALCMLELSIDSLKLLAHMPSQ